MTPSERSRTVRTAVAITTAAVLVAGLAACGGGGGGGDGDEGPPRRGGTLKLVGAGDIDHMDPVSAYYTATGFLERAWTRQLFTYPASTDRNKAIQPTPDIATELPTRQNGGISADGKTYTIKLRDGVMWGTQQPREIVAEDFVRTFKRMANPVQPVGAPGYFASTLEGWQEYFDRYVKAFDEKNANAKEPTAKNLAAFQNDNDIEGVQAKDDKTLVFKLRNPATDFVNILATTFTTPSPVEYDRYVPDSAEFKQNTVSSGPYKITKYTAGKEIVLGRNTAWRQNTDPVRNAWVDQIQVTQGQDSDAAVQQQLESGSADLSWDLPVPTSSIPQLQSANDPNLGVYGGGISNPYLVFNYRSPNAGKAMSKLKVRQAINLAIDKVALGKVYGGSSLNTPLHNAIPPGNVGYKPINLYPTKGNQGDVNRCRQLLREAGYPNGLKLNAAYRNSGNHPRIAQSYAQDLKECGIQVTLSPVRQGDYYGTYLADARNATEGKWDITAPGWIPDWFGNNGRTVLQPLFDSGSCPPAGVNYGCYQSDRVDDLMDQALTAKSEDEAAGLWAQADRQIMEDAAIVPFQDQKTPLYHSSRVKNAIFLPHLNAYFDPTHVWLDGG
ncbi:MAG: ABC transporter substrate-binding protein [Streptosporangiales bacterium]|nr:ABC transporter substrate-binding protein [Streptosporangiales bacterium]